MSPVDSRRALRVVVLGAWTALFAWLWIDGAAIFVGPRTSWIVPFGTVALALCLFVTAVAAVRAGGGGPRPSLRDLAGYAALLAPVMAVVVVDSPQLGANAANRKATVDVSIDELPGNDDALDLASVVAAGQDPSVAEELELDRRARPAAFPGILTARSGSTLQVTRFKIYCCAADAIPFTAEVRDPEGLAAGLEINDWVYVDGTVREQRDRSLIVDARELRPVEPPLDPYL